MIFAPDESLGYANALMLPASGQAFRFDESYRRAHLPLIAPGHPRVIARDEQRGYAMGRHRMIYSAVLPIPADMLDASPQFRAMEQALGTAAFAKKIDWDLLPKRRDVLHATLCGTLSADEAPVIDDDLRQRLKNIGPFSMELRGVFSGNMNVGRLYLQLYPEMRGGDNVIHTVQAAFGRQPTGMYLVGLYNFRDELTVEESAALRAFLLEWWEKPLLRLVCEEIWILGARDDLVLERVIAERIKLLRD